MIICRVYFTEYFMSVEEEDYITCRNLVHFCHFRGTSLPQSTFLSPSFLCLFQPLRKVLSFVLRNLALALMLGLPLSDTQV